jgi:N utilization substance protein B
MPGIDRNILRLAIYEMCFAGEKVPVNIAVNEAVELAKEFGSDASSRFVNGILGKMMRDQQG